MRLNPCEGGRLAFRDRPQERTGVVSTDCGDNTPRQRGRSKERNRRKRTAHFTERDTQLLQAETLAPEILGNRDARKAKLLRGHFPKIGRESRRVAFHHSTNFRNRRGLFEKAAQGVSEFEALFA